MNVWFDTEFTNLNFHTAKLIAIQWQFENESEPSYLDTRYLTNQEITRSLLKFKRHKLIGHNINSDLTVLAKYGFKASSVFDTMLATALLEGKAASHGDTSLKACIQRYVPYLYDSINKETRNAFIDMDQHEEDWNRDFTEEEIKYMLLDVTLVKELEAALLPKLHNNAKLWNVVKLEMSLVPVVANMQQEGIPVNKEKWQSIINDSSVKMEEVRAKLEEILVPTWVKLRKEQWDEDNKELVEWQEKKDSAEAQAHECYEHGYSGTDIKWGKYKIEFMRTWREQNPRPKYSVKEKDLELFNLDSHYHVKAAIQARFNFTLDSTKHSELDSAIKDATDADLKEVLELLLDYKSYAKLISSFGESVINQIGDDVRLHSHFNQLGTDTGRFSCNSPNVQQIPRPRENADIRSCFEAPQGYKFLCADLSNAELRILADESEDENLLDIFNRGVDMHSAVARRMFYLDESADPKTLKYKGDLTYRQIAKTIGFGLVYGMGPGKLASQTGMSMDEAKLSMRNFFNEFPKVKEWLDTKQRESQLSFNAVTKLGRIRSFIKPDRRDEDYKERLSEIGRFGKNHPIQGGCSDVVKKAIVYVAEAYEDYCINASIVSCIHDELLVLVKDEDVDLAKDILSNGMTHSFRELYPKVKFPDVEVNVAKTWVH